jgi:glucose dehydrogenase
MNQKMLPGVIALVVAVGAIVGRAADPKDLEWRAYSGDTASTKYSPLDQINKDTIKNVRIAWRQSGMPMEMRELFPNVQAPNNYEHTPLMVGGLLYMSTAAGTVAALDPATGKVAWFDTPSQRSAPAPPQPTTAPGNGRGGAPAGINTAPPAGRGAATRGVAYWTDGRDQRIIATTGQYLVALNAKNGERYREFGEAGQVDLTKGYERPVTGYRWSSSPLVVRDVIIMGGVPLPATDILNERARAPKEMPPDDIRGYDVRTGKLLWTRG